MNVKFAKRAAIATGIAALSVGLVMPTVAQADPSPAGSFRELVGVGSDTTQDVMNGLSGVIVDPNNSPAHLMIASYDAVNPTTGAIHDTVITRSGHAAVQRPNGSGEGVNNLKADITNGTNNFDFARSSSSPSVPGTEGTWVPFALDAVTVATKQSSTLPANVTLAQLKTAYLCEDASGNPLPANTFPTINGITVHPLVPQAGSGTRKFWASTLGFDAVNLPGCVKDVAKDGSVVEEHDGGSLQRTIAADHSEDIAPFSIAQYLAQGNAIPGVRDRRHNAELRSINGTAPTTTDATTGKSVMNTAFPVTREVYNVIPTSRLSETDIHNAFIGATSKVCTNAATIKTYGFGTVADCGSTTLTGALQL